MWHVFGVIGTMLAAGSSLALSPESPVLSPSKKFERVVIDADFPGGYQVEVADVNGDKKPDIVALGGSTLAWYENPSWKKRVVSTAKQTPDSISSATADLDGDGKAEIAIAYDFAMNEPKRGKLLLAIQGATPDDPWMFKPIVWESPSSTFPGRVPTGGGGGFAVGGGVGRRGWICRRLGNRRRRYVPRPAPRTGTGRRAKHPPAPMGDISFA